jgi:antitoxin component HigA of HigAB toxin-antitoxin module
MSSDPDQLDLEWIVTLAETLNFTETARRLHMTQPGVTARVGKVERNRGYRLFGRSRGMVRSLTPEGFVFVEEATQLLDQLRRLLSRSEAAHRAFSETLSVSRSHHADLRLLSIVVASQALAGARISIGAPGNSDGEAIELLTLLIERYEQERYPIPAAGPAEVVRFLMEQHGLAQRDLVPEFGTESAVSMFLSGQRRLNVNQVRRLSSRFGLPADVFLAK